MPDAGRPEPRLPFLSGLDTFARIVASTFGPTNASLDLEAWLATEGVLKPVDQRRRRLGSAGTTPAYVLATETQIHGHPETQLGYYLLGRAALSTDAQVGDGSATSVLIAHRLVHESLGAALRGHPLQAISRGVRASARRAADYLYELSRPVPTKQVISSIATTAAGDPRIGDFLADVLDAVGKDGVITVEESASVSDFDVTYIEGLELASGYGSSSFLTDPVRDEAAVDDPYVLLSIERLTTYSQLLPVVELVVNAGRNTLAVIGAEVGGSALELLAVNNERGTIPCLAVSLGGSIRENAEDLSDIARLTGATIVGRGRHDLRAVSLNDLGQCVRIVSRSNETTLIGGAGNVRDIRQRVEELRDSIRRLPPGAERERRQLRLARLAAGLARIRVSSDAASRRSMLRERIEAALSALRASVEEGFVVGGGSALLTVAKRLSQLPQDHAQDIGARVLAVALMEPVRQLAHSVGINADRLILDIRELASTGAKDALGLNVLSASIQDLLAIGVVDPVKVLVCALNEAVEASCGLLNHPVLMRELENDKASLRQLFVAPGELYDAHTTTMTQNTPPDTQELVQRITAGQVTVPDLQMLLTSLSHPIITTAGERSVAIKGDLTQGTVVTGDIHVNIVNINISGSDLVALREVLSQRHERVDQVLVATPPNPPEDAPLPGLPLVAIAQGTILFRLHPSKYSASSFSPLPIGRFNSSSGQYATIYVATTLPGALIETLAGRTLVSQSYLQTVSLSRLSVSRPLVVVDLIGSGASRVGISTDMLVSGDFALAQRWADMFWEHPLRPDGVRWRSRFDQTQTLIAVFDRSIPQLHVESTTGLADHSLLSELASAFDEYGIALV